MTTPSLKRSNSWPNGRGNCIRCGEPVGDWPDVPCTVRKTCVRCDKRRTVPHSNWDNAVTFFRAYLKGGQK